MDQLRAHPLAPIAVLIAAVVVFAGFWLAMLSRRGRKATAKPRVDKPVPEAAAAPTPVPDSRGADDSIRAEPTLKMSELERAIGGRFDLPSLDMDPPGPPESPSASAPLSEKILPSGTTRANAAGPGDEVRRLAQSLELAAACLRRNEIELARRLLEDVVRGGDEAQQAFARSLLSKLG